MTRTLHSEDDFLRIIDRHFPRGHERVVLQRGDDAAVVRCPSEMAVSTDLFLEDVHFRTSYFSPGDVGHKALAVNLSDLAAMGALPHGFTLGVMAPPAPHPAATEEYWDELLAAMAALSAKYDCPLVGGDLNRAFTFGLAVTVWGKHYRERSMQRQACVPGDVVFALGALGLARCGLHLLEKHGQDARKMAPQAVAAHLRPEPLVDTGLALANAGARCLMDLSDGLVRDLPRLVGSENGVNLDGLALVSPELESACSAASLDAASCAVLGGEDYALVGAAAPEMMDALITAVPGVRAIGRVLPDPGILLDSLPFDRTGFDHFG